MPGKEGFPETRSGPAKLTELPAAECAGFLWISLDRNGGLDIPGFLGPLADELESWGIGRWAPLGEKVLDCPINWKLAIDTFAENYHFATVHKNTFATIARSNCTVFDSFGPHHRLVFPLNGILDLENIPEEQWDPLQNMVVIYALFPNIVLSATIANGELFRVYPADVPGRSITVHQNSTPLDLSDESVAAGAAAVFDYAHATVRDEDYALVAGLQANLESGARREIGVRPQRARPAAPPPNVVRGDLGRRMRLAYSEFAVQPGHPDIVTAEVLVDPPHQQASAAEV